MFWGLIMEPGKKYSQTVEKSFHISHAALDLDSAQNAPVQVLLGFENRNYLLCTLNKDKWVQVHLDLNFQVGDKVSFATNGPGHVHLTGYLVPEDDYDMGLEEESEDEAEEEEVPELMPINNKKRKADSKNENKKKKPKSETYKLLEDLKDEDDEDDSDVNASDLIDDEEGEEAEEEEDDDEEGDEDDDDAEEEEESEEEEQQPVKKQKKEKPKQNGIVKNQEKSQKADKQNKTVENAHKKGDGEKSPKQKGKKTLQGGVTIEEIKVGEGAPATNGRQVQVFYEGRLQSNNKVFDATKKGNGFKFRLGRQEVIKGWDVGVAGMKVGGKRRIICPPSMAYGAQGSPPVIPPNSTLVFEVELKNVK